MNKRKGGGQGRGVKMGLLQQLALHQCNGTVDSQLHECSE